MYVMSGASSDHAATFFFLDRVIVAIGGSKFFVLEKF